MGAPEGYFAHFSIQCLPIISVNIIYCTNSSNDANTGWKEAFRQRLWVVGQGGSPQVGNRPLAYADGQYSCSTTQVHVGTYHGHTQRAALASGSSSGWGSHENAPQREYPPERSEGKEGDLSACEYTFLKCSSTYLRSHKGQSALDPE